MKGVERGEGDVRGEVALHAPEGLSVVVHDNSKVRGRLLYLQQPQHCRQEAVADGRVFSAHSRQPLPAEAKVRAVQQRMRVHENEPTQRKKGKVSRRYSSPCFPYKQLDICSTAKRKLRTCHVTCTARRQHLLLGSFVCTV